LPAEGEKETTITRPEYQWAKKQMVLLTSLMTYK
jgi:hypothetical protein